MMQIIRADPDPRKAIYRCECGVEFAAFKSNVNRGSTRSCGCLRKAVNRQRFTVHGHSSDRAKSKVYVTWKNMRARCNNAKTADYKNYGGRGIGYDPAWNSFEVFLADMGEPPLGATLDREDNSKGYSKANCRWASRKVQNLNKRSNVRYEFNGKSQTLSEWSRETGIGRVTLLKRLQRGVPLDVALTTKGFLKHKP